MDRDSDPISTSEEILLLTDERQLRHAERKRSTYALWCICITETLERIAFYSLIGNLIFLLNRVELNWTAMNATTETLLTNGISYVSSFLGGLIATYIFGKYFTIALAFVVYITGYFMYPFMKQSGVPFHRFLPPPQFVIDFSEQLTALFCPVASPNSTVAAASSTSFMQSFGSYQSHSLAQNDYHTCNETLQIVPLNSEPCFSAVSLTLALIGIGAGVMKANLLPLGIDQCHQCCKRTRRFVNIFYWLGNAGAGVALVGMIYLQQAVNTFYGTFIPFCLLIVSAIVFLFGRLCFRRSLRDEPDSSTSTSSSTSEILAVGWYFLKLRVCSCFGNSTSQQPHVESYWDSAKQSRGGRFSDLRVNELRNLCRITVFVATLLPFWLVYSQMQCTFIVQGWHMQFFPDISNASCALISGSNDFACDLQIPAASLPAVNIITVITLIPVANWFYRFCESRLHFKIGFTERIIAGHLCAFAAMCVAGCVEKARLNAFWGDAPLDAGDPMTFKHNSIVVQYVGHTPYYAPRMLIFWQIPQYFLIGLAEVLATVATLEYACSQAPRKLTAVVMGIYWFVDGVAHFCGIGVLQLVRGWLLFDNDCVRGLGINCRMLCNSPSGLCVCHLDYYFFLLAGIVLLGMFGFWACAHALDLDLRRGGRSRVAGLNSFAEPLQIARCDSMSSLNAAVNSPHEGSINVVYNRQPSYQRQLSGLVNAGSPSIYSRPSDFEPPYYGYPSHLDD